MHSRVAEQAKRSLQESMRRLTPEERLNAFLEHCQLVMELYKVGQAHRLRSSQAIHEN